MNPQIKHSTIVMQVTCAVLFCLFVFVWLYAFQGDLLAVTQHVLSQGQTHYNHLVGAIIITFLLFGLQMLVASWTRLRNYSYAITFFPSLLLLGVLSDYEFMTGQSYVCYWLAPLLLAAWLQLVRWCKREHSLVGLQNVSGFFSSLLWANVLQLFVMMLVVGFMANTDAVLHYRAHAELALMKGDVEEALRVGEKSAETDESLTMLRAFALSKAGRQPDDLLGYALRGTSADLLPITHGSASLLILPADSIWIHLGARPGSSISSVERYLYALRRDSLAQPAMGNYQRYVELLDSLSQ